MGQIFCITSQKGGVGKTTTTLNLGLVFSGLGQKTLLIDADPQGGLIYALNSRATTEQESRRGLYQVFSGLADIDEIARPVCKPELYLADCGIANTVLDFEALEDAVQARGLFREALLSAAPHYDLILIDCPPGLGLLSVSALISCDYVLIPIQSEPLALRTLPPLIRYLISVKQAENTRMELVGLLLTMHDAESPVSEAVKEQLGTYFDEDLVFKTVIPRDPSLHELFTGSTRLMELYDTLKPLSAGLQAYERLVREIEMKMYKNHMV